MQSTYEPRHEKTCLWGLHPDLPVKRRNDNHSPGPVTRELVRSSHQRSELSNKLACTATEAR